MTQLEHGAPQIPFEFHTPEAKRFENFVEGQNSEALASVRALTHGATLIWGGPGVGKTHILSALIAEHPGALMLTAGAPFPPDPFVSAPLICTAHVDQMSEPEQAWLFTAFNHVVHSLGGKVVATAQSAPHLWSMREDIRSRLASGLVIELKALPQDALPEVLREHAHQRGFSLDDEVLAYLLTRSGRSLAHLFEAISDIDRLSLALKRPVTVPLLRQLLNEKQLNAKKVQ